MALNVLTLGTFDMLHPGHLDLFRWCRLLAGAEGRVTVGVNTDEFVTKFKRPTVIPAADRAQMVAAVKGVDSVVMNDGRNQPALIARAAPDLLVIGSDWARKDYLKQLDLTFDALDQMGVSLCYASRPPEWWSSSGIRQRVADALGQ